MNRIYLILIFVVVSVSAGCSGLLDLMNKDEKEPDPVPVSMEYDGTYIMEEVPDNTRSQFYLRKHSFSYFIRTYFTEGALTLRMLVSSGDEFELNKWYDLPSDETENIWESFAEIEYDSRHWDKEDRMAVAGRVRFTEFDQTGGLNYSGEGYCTIGGEFEITLSDPARPQKVLEIENGQFLVPKSGYWDSRAMED